MATTKVYRGRLAWSSNGEEDDLLGLSTCEGLRPHGVILAEQICNDMRAHGRYLAWVETKGNGLKDEVLMLGGRPRRWKKPPTP